MLKSPVKSLSISTNQEQSTLSRGQKAFNSLIKKIEARRASLSAWQEIIPLYQQKHAAELVPLIVASQDLQVEMVHHLDAAWDKKGLTKAERSKIAEIISGLSLDLAAERGDEALKALYNKYSGSDFDTEEAAAADSLKSMMETMMGVDLGEDIDMSSPDEFIRQARARIQEQAERQAQDAPQNARKKTKKQLAKEAQQLAEEQEIGQSIREVYRKLVSALHPDREPDEEERERKTALMQRVNEAYDKKNLLLLLELQLELEHIDQTTINNMTESRLKHFNKVLKEQLDELEHEIYHTRGSFQAQFDLPPHVAMTPGTLIRHLTTDIIDMQHTIRDIKNDLLCTADIKTLKVWLKRFRQQPKTDYFDEDEYF